MVKICQMNTAAAVFRPLASKLDNCANALPKRRVEFTARFASPDTARRHGFQLGTVTTLPKPSEAMESRTATLPWTMLLIAVHRVPTAHPDNRPETTIGPRSLVDSAASNVSEQRRKEDHDQRRPGAVDRQVIRLPFFE